MDQFERWIIRDAACSAMFGFNARKVAFTKRCSSALAHWLQRNAAATGVRMPSSIKSDEFDPDSNERISKESWAAMAPVIGRIRSSVLMPRTSPLERRLNWLCETLELSEPESKLLKLMVRAKIHRPLNELAHIICDTYARNRFFCVEDADIGLLAIMKLTGESEASVRRMLSPCEPLMTLGLIMDAGDGDSAPSGTVMRLATLRTTDPKLLQASLIGKGVRPELEWQDFAHLGEMRDLVERLLSSAIRNGEAGINILLHGSPGTGKTQFVRTLSERLKTQAVFVGEQDKEGTEPRRASRIAAYSLLQALAGRTRNTMLVMDEADDVFTGVDEDDARSRVGSKVFMNRLVEKAAAPTVWITNNPNRLGPSVVRRMTLALRFPLPSQAVRRRIVARIAVRRSMKLNSVEMDDLSGVSAPPAIIDTAMRVAQIVGSGSASESSLALRSLLQAMNVETPMLSTEAISFDPALSCAETNLQSLADQIERSGQLAFSMCLHGISGTGKSAFALYLADRLGLDVIHKRASDLLDKYVGGSEKRIADAFFAASDQRAMLIIDEADSMLRDRARAQQSWEVTKVNEMLTWMETHPYPFVCTTNLMDTLDPATLRRFLFKVRFLPMSPVQIRETFSRAFGCAAPLETERLETLTPGDFSLVARKARIMGATEPTALGKMLAEEVQQKPGSGRAKLGF